MCWRTLSKNENVRWLFSLAPGSQMAMDAPLWPVAFAPPPAPSPTAQTPLGRGRKKLGLCRRATPACKAPQKKPPFPSRGAGGRGQGIGGKS